MKKLIRQSVWETNSSSTHSLSITSSNNLNDTIIPAEDGTITLTGGEFGWEIEDYWDAFTKANYCALDICPRDWVAYRKYSADYKSHEDIKPEINSEEAELNDRLKMLVKVIKEHTGAYSIIFKLEGYIDHQSRGTSNEAFENEETLKQFLFSKSSGLHTDNDNH